MNQYDPQKHHRRSIRLKGYDYSQPGAYFVTICVRNWGCTLGSVVDGEMQMTEYGHIAHDFWADVPVHFPNVSIDIFIVMPNHVHVIIMINAPQRRGAVIAPYHTPQGGATPPLRDDTTPDCRGAVIAPYHTPQGGATPPLRDDATPDCRGAVIAPYNTPQGGATPPLRDDATPDCRGAVIAPYHASQGGATPPRLQPQIVKPTLGQIVAYYKYQTTKQINQILGNAGLPFWQRDFYDHIIRNHREIDAIRQYIANNPLRWELDRDNPINIRADRRR